MFERKAIINTQFGRSAGDLLGRLGWGETEEKAARDGELAFGQALTQENFAWVYTSYFPRLYNYVSCRASSREEAEDIVALVFEQILNKFHTYDPQRGNLDTWIFTIARNALTDRHRYKRRHREQALDEHLELEADFSLSDQFLRQEEVEQLRVYMGRLSPREQELLVLRYGAGLTHRRIGEIMKMNEGNVAVVLGRTVRKLHRFFEEDTNQNEINIEVKQKQQKLKNA